MQSIDTATQRNGRSQRAATEEIRPSGGRAIWFVLNLRFPSARLAPLLAAPIHVPSLVLPPAASTRRCVCRPRPTRASSTQVRPDLHQRYTFVALCDTGGTAQRRSRRGRERCEARGPALLAGHGSHVLGMARRARSRALAHRRINA
jgi:hypothetical protein